MRPELVNLGGLTGVEAFDLISVTDPQDPQERCLC